MTCVVHSSPSTWPPETAMSFLGPASNKLPSEPVFAKLERSLIGAKMLRRDPLVFRRNMTWLGRIRSNQGLKGLAYSLPYFNTSLKQHQENMSG